MLKRFLLVHLQKRWITASFCWVISVCQARENRFRYYWSDQPGIWAVLPTGITGIFRANESSWERLDEKSQAFVLSKPNLLLQITRLGKSSCRRLDQPRYPGAAYRASPVFLLIQARMSNSTRSATRIVLADGLPRFLTGLFQARPCPGKRRYPAAGHRHSRGRGSGAYPCRPGDKR